MKIFKHFGLLATTASGVSLACGPAMAGTLTVTYNVPAAVPLSPAMIAVLGIALAGSTLFLMRSRGLSQGVAGLVAGVIAVGGLGYAGVTHAIVLQTLSLDGSGSNVLTFSDSETSHTISVTNGSSRTLTLETLTPSGSGYHIHAPGTTCEVGTVLNPGADCRVQIEQYV